MIDAIHGTAHNRAKTARMGAFAQLAGGGGHYLLLIVR